MDLIALAVPFFLLAIVIELIIDKVRGMGLLRANDAINSLSAGILSTTTGYFTKLLPLIAWGFFLQNFALIDMPLEWFDLSARGIALWIIAALAWDFFVTWTRMQNFPTLFTMAPRAWVCIAPSFCLPTGKIRRRKRNTTNTPAL